MYKETNKHMVPHSVDVLEQLAASIFRLIERHAGLGHITTVVG